MKNQFLSGLLVVVSMMVSACSPTSNGAGAANASGVSDAGELHAITIPRADATLFAKWRARDEDKESLNCDELVARLSPAYEGGQRAITDYVAHEEELNHYQFQQCRKSIREQADAVCQTAAEALGSPESSAFYSEYADVTELDAGCISKVRAELKNDELQYQVTGDKVPFLKVQGTEESLYNLSQLVHIEKTDSTRYPGITTYEVRAQFGASPSNGESAPHNLSAVFLDEGHADAFVAVLTQQKCPQSRPLARSKASKPQPDEQQDDTYDGLKTRKP
jgi:hypothetical protein